MIRIATILTCYNRREKTTVSLQHLLQARDQYNCTHAHEPIELSVFLTDDACTDGTTEAVRKICHDVDLHIVPGDGHCYWAGGMRLAWCEAMRQHTDWNFYLLLNDDTIVMDQVFDQLLACHAYALEQYNKGGLYSGITCSRSNPTHITYGGKKRDPHTRGWYLAQPSGQPQAVDNTQANILLIAKHVVDAIGIFPDCYIHGAADEDYSMTVRRKGLPILVTAETCGYCENDHLSEQEETLLLCHMSLRERRNYVYHPTHSDRDYLTFVRRNMPSRLPFSWMLRKVRLLTPRLYYKICKKRGIYQ